MGDTSAIEWTQATWNPWYGCTKVSPGCAHCYMFREMRQYGRDPEVVTRSKTKFRDPLKWKDPRVIFTCSWGDWFHEGADTWRDEAWDVIRRTPRHTYQILTKRPHRIISHLPADWGKGYPNVLLGVSIEGQRYDYRACQLIATPAAGYFVSAEPLLGSLDLTRCSPAGDPVDRRGGTLLVNVLRPNSFGRRIGWVIAGGESGPEHRPMELDWARSLRDQCVGAGVPYFLKQLGGWPGKRGGDEAVLDGERWTQMPALARAVT